MAKAPKKTNGQAQPAEDVLPEIDDDAVETGLEAGSEDAQDDLFEDQPRKQAEAEREEPEDPRAAIARKYRENRDAKAAGENESDADDGDDGDDGDEVVENDDHDGEEAASSTQKSERPVASQDPEVVLKVDGKDVKMKQSEVLALAQQQMAGMNRLDEAKNVLSEVKQLRNELLTNARAPRESGQPENQRDPADEKSTHQSIKQQGDDRAANQPRPSIDPEKVRDIAGRLQIGDETEGAEALMEAIELAASQRPEMNAEQVARVVQETLDNNQAAVEINTALSDFGNDYPDVVTNPYLADAGMHILRDELTADLKAAGIPENVLDRIKDDAAALAKAQRLVRRQYPTAPMRSYKDLLGAVGEKMAENFGIKRREASTPHQQAKPSNAPQQRLERKRSASQQPKPAGMRQAITPASKPRDRRAIVEQIRRERGFN